MADKASVQTIKTAVGALMDIGEPDANTTPTETQIQHWIHDAATAMARILPPHLCGGLFTKYSNGNGSTACDKQIVKVVSIMRASAPCQIVDVYEYNRMATVFSAYEEDAPVATVEFDGDGSARFKITPGGYAQSYAYIIQVPGAISNDTWADPAPPTAWTDLLIEYCVMKAKYQDEEPEQSQLAHNNWVEAVSAFGGLSADSRSSR